MTPEASNETPGHYFDAQPAATSSPTSVTLTLPDLQMDLTTDRGVFSGQRVDPGTKLLLLEAARAQPAASNILDLGCGYGPISLVLAKRNPQATIWAIDSNARARGLCAQNAEQLGVANVEVRAPEDIDPDLRFDLLCSNPPIRIGKDALHELLQTWLGRLESHGTAELVVQKHLGSDSLARWLTSVGWTCERVVSRRAYRVLRCSNAADPQAEAADEATLHEQTRQTDDDQESTT